MPPLRLSMGHEFKVSSVGIFFFLFPTTFSYRHRIREELDLTRAKVFPHKMERRKLRIHTKGWLQ